MRFMKAQQEEERRQLQSIIPFIQTLQEEEHRQLQSVMLSYKRSKIWIQYHGLLVTFQRKVINCSYIPLNVR